MLLTAEKPFGTVRVRVADRVNGTCVGAGCAGLAQENPMTNYFTPQMSKLVVPRASLRVTQQSAPPADDTVTEAAYANFPLTIASVGECYSSRSSTWSGTLQHKIWCNRYTGGYNTKPNPTQTQIARADGKACWLAYSTLPGANAATLARLSYSAGYLQNERDGVSGWGDICAAAGLTAVYTWDEANANAAMIFSGTSAISTDVVVLPRTRLYDTLTGKKEFALDYEPQDSRAASYTTDLVTRAIALAHGRGYTLGFYTNPLDGPGGTPYNGVDKSNIDSLLAMVDYFNILIYSGSPSGNVLTSFNTQVGWFTNPDFTKMQVTWGLDCTPTDAATIRDQMRLKGFAGVEFWTNGTTLGGDCSTNANGVRQIATLVGVASC